MPARGRGAGDNPHNRFEQLRVEADVDAWVDEDPRPLHTTFLRDDSQSVLSTNEADDISFDYGLNPYRGCEHGCAYCYARIYHEYLGFSAGLDFESKIVVKHDAPELLEKELAKNSYKPGVISLSGATDCYQPVERKLGLTRRCLEVLTRFRNPVVVITKNTLVTRDIDHLSELTRHRAVAVFLSVTTLDPDLARVLEPRAPTPRARLETIRTLTDAGIPAGVCAAPMIPGLNDSELAAILTAAAEHGASFAAYSLVRLPGAVTDVFSGWLERHRPLARKKSSTAYAPATAETSTAARPPNACAAAAKPPRNGNRSFAPSVASTASIPARHRLIAAPSAGFPPGKRSFSETLDSSDCQRSVPFRATNIHLVTPRMQITSPARAGA